MRKTQMKISLYVINVMFKAPNPGDLNVLLI